MKITKNARRYTLDVSARELNLITHALHNSGEEDYSYEGGAEEKAYRRDGNAKLKLWQTIVDFTDK